MSKIVFYQGMTSSIYQYKRFTDASLPNHIQFKESDFVSFDEDIEEVVYWNQATVYERVTLFPWFFVNWLIQFYCRLIYPTSAKAVAPVHAIRWWLINVAQDRDIEEHRKRLAVARLKHPNVEQIVFGVSRGAATTFCSIATLKQWALKNVKLVVLEGCFDYVTHVLHLRYGRLTGIIQYLLSFFTDFDQFKSYHISPLSLAHQFPKNIPVALITSRCDKQVPYECTKDLYDALVAQGHPNVHLLVLDKDHNDYYTGVDAIQYYDFLNTLKLRYISSPTTNE